MRALALLTAVLMAGLVVATDALAGSVRGYHRRDGTYVQPHYRTNPDSNPYNNYGYPGNYNPNTGRITGGDQNRYLDNYYNRGRSNPYGNSGSSDSLWND